MLEWLNKLDRFDEGPYLRAIINGELRKIRFRAADAVGLCFVSDDDEECGIEFAPWHAVRHIEVLG